MSEKYEEIHKMRSMLDALKDPHIVSGAELERFRACVSVLESYERWEADLILENKSWTGQNVIITDELYDRLIGLQNQRNTALGRFASTIPSSQRET
jgi:hypothetical protein